MIGRFKLVLVLRRPEGQDASAFARQVLDRAAAETTTDRGCVVDLVDQPPVEAAGLPSPGAPPLDALVELWPSRDQAPAIVAAWGTHREFGLHAAYITDEVVQRDHLRTGPADEPTPGVKAVYLVQRNPDLAPEGFVDHWRTIHAPLALRHHVGATRYVQNAVTARLAAPTGDAEVEVEVDGIAELHFASSQDLVERLYDSSAGMRAIADDVARFVGAAVGYLVTEHVLHGPDQR